MRPWVIYSLIRIGLLAVIFAALLMLGITWWLAAIFATLIAMAISYLAFPKLRAQVVASVAERSSGGKHQTLAEVDAAAEDAEIAEAAESAHASDAAATAEASGAPRVPKTADQPDAATRPEQ